MNWKELVKAVAPTLGAALGGPLAGVAVKTLSDKFLADGEEPSEAKLEEFFLGATPAQLAETKSLDNQFKLDMQKLNVDVFKIEAADKDSARKYNKDSYMPAVLSISLTLLIGVLLWALFKVEPPQGAKEILFMLLGIVVREWANAMHYWFGTTKSSSDKSKLLGVAR